MFQRVSTATRIDQLPLWEVILNSIHVTTRIAREQLFSMAQPPLLNLRQEVDALVQLQIHALTQQSALNFSQLQDCHARFERIMDLQEEVARLRKESILSGPAPRLDKQITCSRDLA